MSYNKTVWKNGQSPAINESNLNNIENGIDLLSNSDTLPFTKEYEKIIDSGALKDSTIQNLVVEGVSYQNLMENSDVFTFIPITVSTVLGVLPSGGFVINPNYSATEQIFPVKNNNVYFLYFLCDPSSTADVQALRLRYADNSTVNTTSSNRQEIGEKVTSNRTDDCNFKVVTAAQNGTVAKGRAMIIDMTALGIESFTNEQMLQVARNLLANTEIQHVEGELRSTGKNLLKFEGFKTVIQTGYTFESIVKDVSDTYTFTRAITDLLYIYALDIYGNVVQTLANGTSSTQISLSSFPSNTYKLAFVVRESTRSTDFDIDTWQFQIVKGTTVIPYQKYIESVLTLPQLKRVPNGVSDKDNLKNTDLKILSGSDVNGFVTTGVNVNYATIPIGILVGAVTFDGNVKSLDTLIQNSEETTLAEIDSLNGVGKYITGATSLVFLFDKTVTTQSQAEALINDRFVVYQLAQPIPRTGGTLTAYVDGTIYWSGLAGVISGEWPLNEAAEREGANQGLTIVNNKLSTSRIILVTTDNWVTSTLPQYGVEKIINYEFVKPLDTVDLRPIAEDKQLFEFSTFEATKEYDGYYKIFAFAKPISNIRFNETIIKG